MAVVSGFVAAVLVLAPLKEARVWPRAAANETVLAHDVDLEPARDKAPRTVYPFSVIPGGVYSAEEFVEAVAADPPVSAHYTDITLAAMRVETVDAPRAAYMSYRIGDQIYWTKRKLALHDGERVLSDGRVTVRARCGNRLSDEPMLPTSDAEPPVDAFEGNPAPPVAAPKLSFAAVPPPDPPMEPASVSEPLDSVAFPGWIGPFGIPFLIKDHSDDPYEGPGEFWIPPVVFPPGDPDSTDGDDTHGGPPLVVPPTTGFPSLTPPGDGTDDGPFDEPPVDVPPGFGTPPGEVPPPAVPEPTSLTLFGTGAAWLAFKRYRQRNRR